MLMVILIMMMTMMMMMSVITFPPQCSATCEGGTQQRWGERTWFSNKLLSRQQCHSATYLSWFPPTFCWAPQAMSKKIYRFVASNSWLQRKCWLPEGLFPVSGYVEVLPRPKSAATMRGQLQQSIALAHRAGDLTNLIPHHHHHNHHHHHYHHHQTFLILSPRIIRADFDSKVAMERWLEAGIPAWDRCFCFKGWKGDFPLPGCFWSWYTVICMLVLMMGGTSSHAKFSSSSRWSWRCYCLLGLMIPNHQDTSKFCGLIKTYKMCEGVKFQEQCCLTCRNL